MMSRVSKKEKIFYTIIGMIFVIALSVLMTVRVQSKSREAVLFDNRNYEAAEELYKQRVQQVLESYDCYNSGLTMTRIVSLDGEREYNIQIYNSKIQKLDSDTFEKLCSDVAACAVSLPDGSEYFVQASFEK